MRATNSPGESGLRAGFIEKVSSERWYLLLRVIYCRYALFFKPWRQVRGVIMNSNVLLRVCASGDDVGAPGVCLVQGSGEGQVVLTLTTENAYCFAVLLILVDLTSLQHICELINTARHTLVLHNIFRFGWWTCLCPSPIMGQSIIPRTC